MAASGSLRALSGCSRPKRTHKDRAGLFRSTSALCTGATFDIVVSGLREFPLSSLPSYCRYLDKDGTRNRSHGLAASSE